MQYHHAPVQRELPHVYFKISISPGNFAIALRLLLSRVMAWRSLFEVRLNAGFWYINSQQQYHRSKYWGSFDFSTADEKVAPALFDAAIISLIVWAKTAERSRARTQE